jgi:hypothetical protein
MEVHQVTSTKVDRQLIHMLAIQKLQCNVFSSNAMKNRNQTIVVSSNTAIGLETPSTLKEGTKSRV